MGLNINGHGKCQPMEDDFTAITPASLLEYGDLAMWYASGVVSRLSLEIPDDSSRMIQHFCQLAAHCKTGQSKGKERM